MIERVRAARCHRSLKRDEEITLWRSLCALGAPLYGNLCISFSPFLSSHSISFSPPPSRSFTPSLSFSRPNASLRFSSFFLVHLALERLFLPSPSFPAYSPQPPSHPPPPRSLTRSVRYTRHGISPIPSFPPRFFPSASHLLVLLSFSIVFLCPLSLLFAGPHSISLLPDCSRTSTFAPLFPFGLFSVASG